MWDFMSVDQAFHKPLHSGAGWSSVDRKYKPKGLSLELYIPVVPSRMEEAT